MLSNIFHPSSITDNHVDENAEAQKLAMINFKRLHKVALLKTNPLGEMEFVGIYFH